MKVAYRILNSEFFPLSHPPAMCGKLARKLQWNQNPEFRMRYATIILDSEF
jgi:hypothetical protein